MALWDSVEQKAQSPYSHPWLAQAIFALDIRLRRRQSVIEYTRHPGCVFRLQIDLSRQKVALSDGTHARPGQRIGRLHFWNEHIPPMPARGATIAWARQLQQCIATSLRELTLYLSSRPDLRDVALICADVPSATREQRAQIARIMAYYGFETIAEQERLPLHEGLHRFAENILISLTVFAQNACALRLDSLRRVRVRIVISRRALQERFGGVEGLAAEVAKAP